MIEFKPSQVRLNFVPPLVDTMHRVEREIAAAMLVRTCQVHGDAWAPVWPKDMGAVFTDDVKAGKEPWKSLNTNPFYRPDFHDLIDAGYARWADASLGLKSPIELTEKGLEALRRHVVA